METEYALRGLDCPSCAAKIETEIKALSGVTSVSYSVINSTLVLITSDSYSGNLTADITKIVHRHEPDVEIIAKEDATDKPQRDIGHGGRSQIIQLAAGTALFIAAVLFKGSDIRPYLYLASYAVLGWKVILKAVRNLFKGSFFDENFLMSLATGGAFILGEYPEAVAVMLFYLVGEYFQDLAVRRSRRSIADLMDIRPDFANVTINGALARVKPESVKIGDIIVVRPGERIPLDGIVLSGESMLDTKALTGESMPRSAGPSDTVLSGCVNLNGVLSIEVSKSFGESTASRIINLVENASANKAKTENFITSFSRYYTPVVVGMAALLALLPPLILGGGWAGWIHRALVFLVISCPCALVISIPLGFFGGIGGASKKGILVKGGNYLEALNSIDIVVFDKTGTLTYGVFKVTGIHPADGVSGAELLECAAFAESFSNHPIALSVMAAHDGVIDNSAVTNCEEIPGYGVSVTANGRRILAGNAKLMEKEGVDFPQSFDLGTKVYVSADGRFMGLIVISDEIKADSRAAIEALRALGVRKTVMLTGDDSQIAQSIARELSIDEVYAQLLPDRKVEIVEKLEKQKRAKGKLAFVGDGINDAPVLARSDIGVAMGGLGSDAAIEAADVVLMTDEPSRLVDAIKIAKATKRIVWQNIIFALGVKGVFMLLGAIGISGMWEAVFADVGVSILAIFNSLRALKVS